MMAKLIALLALILSTGAVLLTISVVTRVA